MKDTSLALIFQNAAVYATPMLIKFLVELERMKDTSYANRIRPLIESQQQAAQAEINRRQSLTR